MAKPQITPFTDADIENYKCFNACKYCTEKNPVCLDIYQANWKEYTIPKKDITLGEFIFNIRNCSVLCANCYRKYKPK